MTAGEDKQVCLFNPFKDGAHESTASPPSSSSSSSSSCSSSTEMVKQKDDESLLIKTYAGAHGYAVLALDISLDNNHFVSAGYDRCAFYWDVTTAQPIRRFQNNSSQSSGTGGSQHSTNRINTVKLNGVDNSLCFTGSYDKTLSVWDLRNRNSSVPVQTLTDFRDSISKIALTNHEIVASCIDGALYIYDLRMGLMYRDTIETETGLNRRKSPLVSCSISASNELILTNCLGSEGQTDAPGTLCVTEKRSGKLLKSFIGHQNIAYGTESGFLFNDTYVCTGSEDGSLVVYDLVKGANTNANANANTNAMQAFGVHGAGVASLCLSSCDGSDVSHSQAPHPLLPQESVVTNTHISRSCHVVTSAYNGEASLWKLTRT